MPGNPTTYKTKSLRIQESERVMKKYQTKHGLVVKYHHNGTFEFLTFDDKFTPEQAERIANLLNSELDENIISRESEFFDLDRQDFAP
jgi:hypothetical protein